MKKSIDAKSPKESIDRLSSGQLIEARTIKVFTLRKTDDLTDSLRAIVEDLSSLNLKAVDVARNVSLYLALLPIPQVFEIAFYPYKERAKRTGSTTFGLNAGTQDVLNQVIDQANVFAKASNFRYEIDMTNLLIQGIYHFERLTRDEKIHAVRSVNHEFGDLMRYLTPKQADNAMALT